jgi:pyridoxamine 5'-phosphate oxidase
MHKILYLAFILLFSVSVYGQSEIEKLEQTEKYKEGNVPLPPHWGGYIVHPTQVEFWQGRSSRLHDRIRYSFENHQWTKQRLAP